MSHKKISILCKRKDQNRFSVRFGQTPLCIRSEICASIVSSLAFIFILFLVGHNISITFFSTFFPFIAGDDKAPYRNVLRRCRQTMAANVFQ